MAFDKKKLLKYSSPGGFIAAKAVEKRADPEYQEAKRAEQASQLDLQASGVTVELIHHGNLPSLGLWSAVPARITINASGITIQQRSKMFANAGKFEVKCAFPWEEVEDVFVDGRSHVMQRITATRVAMLGPLSVLARKSKVEGKTNMIIYLGDKTKGRSGQLVFQKDREDAALIHRISKALDDYMPGNGEAAPGDEAIDIPDQIQKLAALRDGGILTDAEFDAKKAELLKRL